MLLFLIIFFCSFECVNQIVFQDNVLCQKNIFIYGNDVFFSDLIIDGGIHSYGTSFIQNVQINNDIGSANYLIFDSAQGNLSFFVKNLPIKNFLSSFLVLDPDSFLVYSYTSGDPEPHNLIANSIASDVISCYNAQNLIINNIRGDITLGNAGGVVSCNAKNIIVDGPIDSALDQIVFDANFRAKDEVLVSDISVKDFFLLGDTSFISSDSIFFSNLFFLPTNHFSINGKNEVLFNDIISADTLDIANNDRASVSFSVIDIPQKTLVENCLGFLENNHNLCLFPLQFDTVIVDRVAANQLKTSAIVPVPHTNIDLYGSQIVFSSPGSQAISLSGFVSFDKRCFFSNKIIFQDKVSFSQPLLCGTINLKDNTTPINADNFTAQSSKDEGDYSGLAINGFLRILYPVVTNVIQPYTSLVINSSGRLLQSAPKSDFRHKVSRDISFENFKQFFCPKIFSYKKEYCFDTCKKSVFQTRRIGLLVEDIEAMEDKVLLDDIIIKNESGEAINYDERAVAFLCIDQLKALYKKYIDYKITLKKENNFIVKIKKKIDTVESEIEDYKRILESA